MTNMIANPILTGFHPDPSICRCGEDYYIATSTFEWFPGVRIFHSKDFRNWELVSRPLDRVSQLDMKGDPDSGGIWAPCLTYANGRFWLLYTDVKAVYSPWKNGRNYLVTAENIEGPWSEPISMGNGGFDPSLFHEDGRIYYVYRPWGPRHHSNPHNNIVIQEYFPDEQRLSTERHKLFSGTDRKFTEGPHIYKKDNYYYLLLAEGGTVYEHCMVVARSENLLGPYELHPDETIITTENKPDNIIQKSGHGCFVQTHTNEWYMVYLVGRPLKLDDKNQENIIESGYCPLGRETSLDKLTWKNDWPYAVGGQHAKDFVEAPQIPLQSSPQPSHFIDKFESTELHPEWQTLRIPFTNKIGELRSTDGVLRLFGKDSLISTFTQATVAKRWLHFNFDALTKFNFEPKNEQQSAGLTCYYNTNNWSYCFVDFDEELQQKTIKLIQVDHGIAQYFCYESPILIPATTEDVFIKVSVRELTYRYSYSFNGKNWIEIDIEFEAWKLSDDYIAGKGFFTGAFVGLHCADISADGCYADYKYFEYQPI